MKKILKLGFLIIMPVMLAGCTSNITAKYDDYNETFTGKSYYDPMTARAVIDVTSDKNGTHCIGNGNFRGIPIWQFNLTCSDGRKIIGTIQSALPEGTAFTNRNETITFTVAKRQSTIKAAQDKYTKSINNKPSLDNSKRPMTVIME